MPTIDELMQGKAPGEIKVTRKDWDWFQPFYRSEEYDTGAWWYGVRKSGKSDCFVAKSDSWQLWQEPPTTRCDDCEKLRKERDEAIETLRKVRAQLGIGEWTR